MLTQKEVKQLNEAIEVKRAALKRAANTEKDADIREMRVKAEQEYANLQAKINTKGLFDETANGKQTK